MTAAQSGEASADRVLQVQGDAAAVHAGLTGLQATDARKNNKNKPVNPDATGQRVRSAKTTTDNCIAGASGNTQLFTLGGAENMNVNGLPANTEFDAAISAQGPLTQLS